jgi:agmatine deiminase
MITDFDTNSIYFSELLRSVPRYKKTCDQITTILDSYQIKYSFLPNTKDIWARDFMPVQIADDTFVEYRYDPDYLHGKKYRPIKTYPDIVCDTIGLKTIKTELVIDGGNVIKSSNCLILTDKVVEENSHLYKRQELIEKLKEVFQVNKIVLIPWDKEDYLGHADGMIRFIDDNTVLLQGYYEGYDERFKQKLFGELEQNGIKWKMLKFDVQEEDEQNWAYMNFLQTKDIILMPLLNIEEDEQAFRQMSECFPEYSKRDRIKQIDMAEILKGGGALNCISWTVKQ